MYICISAHWWTPKESCTHSHIKTARGGGGFGHMCTGSIEGIMDMKEFKVLIKVLNWTYTKFQHFFKNGTMEDFLRYKVCSENKISNWVIQNPWNPNVKKFRRLPKWEEGRYVPIRKLHYSSDCFLPGAKSKGPASVWLSLYQTSRFLLSPKGRSRLLLFLAVIPMDPAVIVSQASNTQESPMLAGQSATYQLISSSDPAIKPVMELVTLVGGFCTTVCSCRRV